MRPFKPPAISASEITPESVFHERRTLLKLMGFAGVGALLSNAQTYAQTPAGTPLPHRKNTAAVFNPADTLTPYEHITGYNNFYELGFSKEEPAANASKLITAPWSVTVSGEVNKPGTYTLEDILKPHALEERIYRMRCVEAWSMVIPWIGFPLKDLLARFEPTANAKYVAFESIHDPEHLPGQQEGSFQWPYIEGLRMDEALHPLTMLAVGLYGNTLSEPERRTFAFSRAMEIRFQRHQVDCQNSFASQ